MKLTRLLLIICCLPLGIQLMLAVPSYSKTLYTWKDKNGVTHRTYYRPPAEYTQKSQSSTSSQQTAQQNRVDLYVTSWCPYCKKARQFFDSRGIKYKAYDIEKDAKAAARQRKLDSRKGVPFAVINGTAIHGYSPERYASALK
jgi:glutaredoxin